MFVPPVFVTMIAKLSLAACAAVAMAAVPDDKVRILSSTPRAPLPSRALFFGSPPPAPHRLAGHPARFWSLSLTVSPRHASQVTTIPGFGTPVSNMYSGYLAAGKGKMAHYVFSESFSKPATDDLIIWFNGECLHTIPVAPRGVARWNAQDRRRVKGHARGRSASPRARARGLRHHWLCAAICRPTRQHPPRVS